MLPERGARRAMTLYDIIRGEASTLLGLCKIRVHGLSMVSPPMHYKCMIFPAYTIQGGVETLVHSLRLSGRHRFIIITFFVFYYHRLVI